MQFLDFFIFMSPLGQIDPSSPGLFFTTVLVIFGSHFYDIYGQIEIRRSKFLPYLIKLVEDLSFLFLTFSNISVCKNFQICRKTNKIQTIVTFAGKLKLVMRYSNNSPIPVPDERSVICNHGISIPDYFVPNSQSNHSENIYIGCFVFEKFT